MDEIIYDQKQMEEMISILHKSATDLRASIGRLQAIARKLNTDDGGLQGDAGDEFTQAINQTLAQSMTRLAEDLDKRGRFVRRELDQLLKVAKKL